VKTVPGGYDIVVKDDVYHVLMDWNPGDPLVNATVNGRQVCFQQDKLGAGIRLFRRGAQIDVTVCNPRAAELKRHMLDKVAPDLSKFLLSPMPGLLVKLAVKQGDEIKAGEELAVVEAMKMENSLRAENDVVIAKVLTDQGGSLVVDQPILEFE
jgi:propionyl-CoA carboxylase alpha chain